MKKILNYIDGNLKDALSKKIIENESPVDGKVFSHIADSDKAVSYTHLRAPRDTG
mgnify:CR=1 FL=1